MLSAFREMQIPLLAALLVLACAGKAVRAARTRSIDQGLGPTTMFPLRLRRPAAMVMCAIEFGLGLMLVATAGRRSGMASGRDPGAARRGPALRHRDGRTHRTPGTPARRRVRLFRRPQQHPASACAQSSAPPFSPSAAAATVGRTAGPADHRRHHPWRGARHASTRRLLVVLVAAEVVLLGALSPELGEALVRLGYREPCERRTFSPQRTLAALRSSRVWRRHAALLTSAEPTTCGASFAGGTPCTPVRSTAVRPTSCSPSTRGGGARLSGPRSSTR